MIHDLYTTFGSILSININPTLEIVLRIVSLLALAYLLIRHINIQKHLQEYKSMLNSDVKGLETKIVSDVKGLETKIVLDIKGLETKIVSDVKGLETKFVLDVKGLETKIVSDVKGLETKFVLNVKRLETRIDSLEQQIVNMIYNGKNQNKIVDQKINQVENITVQQLDNIKKELTIIINELKTEHNKRMDHHANWFVEIERKLSKINEKIEYK